MWVDVNHKRRAHSLKLKRDLELVEKGVSLVVRQQRAVCLRSELCGPSL